MGAEFYLAIVDTAGATQAVVTDYLSLRVAQRVNHPGLCIFQLGEGSPGVAAASINSQVEVWRRNPDIGLAWTREFVGVIRGLQWSTEEATVLTVTAPGILHALAWRLVAYAAGVSNRSDFSAAKGETVLKRIVQYNATASGTVADGRKRDAVDGSGKLSGLYTITIQADGALGSTISVGVAWRNVLAAIQDVATIAGGDFALVKTGALTFDFRFYLGQLGTDRTTTVVFSLDRGNMAAPTYTANRMDESTVAIVAGQGEGTGRAVEIVTGADYAASRNVETFVDGRAYSTTAALQSAGAEELVNVRAKDFFSFSVLQVPNAYYGVHYFLGDKVKAIYNGTSYTQKVLAVEIDFAPAGAETIKVETENV